MSNSNDGLTNGQRNIAAEIARNGEGSADFTRDEKLGLVANGLMDPKEVGMTSAEEAKLEIMPDAEKVATLGDAVMFQCGVVPIDLRAEWARQQLTIVPTDISAWKQDWVAANEKTFLVQGVMHCGTAVAKFQRTYSDPTLGLAMMLRLAGEMLEKKYTGEELPPSTDAKSATAPQHES